MIKPRHLLSVLCAGAAILVSLPNYAAESTAACPSQVNINQADEKQLQCLAGVGGTKAKNIVQYRTQKADHVFNSLDELTKVKGINSAMLEKWKQGNKITLK